MKKNSKKKDNISVYRISRSRGNEEQANRLFLLLSMVQKKIYFASFISLSFVILVIFKLFSFNAIENSSENEIVSAYYLPPMIEDRNGIQIAVNKPVYKVIIDLDDIWDRKLGRISLEHILEKKLDAIEKTSSRWYEIPFSVDEQKKQELLHSGISGLHFKKNYQRFYPYGNLLSHIIGYSDINKKGVTGIEALISQRKLKQTVRSSIDIRVQKRIYNKLSEYKNNFNAKSAWAIMMNVNNGEIVSLISLPDYDNNNLSDGYNENWKNKVFSDVYEFGSVFKIFTLAMYLENGNSLSDLIPVHRKISFKDHVIRDRNIHKAPLTAKEIIARSSNLGAAYLGLDIPQEDFYSSFYEFGLLSPLDFDLIENREPLYPNDWSSLERAIMSFGHSIAVTPAHITTTYSAMVNGGYKVNPKIIIDNKNEKTQIISNNTSSMIINAMRGVVEDGTGRNVKIKGYDIIGKTGTAEKITAGTYDENQNLFSFVSAFPGENPEYVLLVSIDQPISFEQNISTSNTVVKMTKEILEEILPILNIHPQDKNINVASR